MMKSRIMFIESKSHPGGHDDRGPAWIGRVKFSKTGRTMYYRGREIRRARGGVSGCGNCYDVATGNHYWVSGPKKNGEDRHWSVNASVEIDADVREEYWTSIRQLPERASEKLA